MKIKSLFYYLAVAVLFVAIGPIRSLAVGPGTVNITSPANGAQITASCSSATANITINVDAFGWPPTNNPTGGGGGGATVDKVEVYYNTTHLIGTDFSSPYSVVWANVPVGTYTLTARAYFSNGSSQPSSAVVITVKSPATTLDSNQSGYTFESGKTYYIKNPITISGTTVLQGGAVLKYAPAATVTVDTLDCQTSSNNPAILTARDDDSVGCMLPESTHVISGYYAGFDTFEGTLKGALSVNNYDSPLVKYVNVSYANCALYFLNYGSLNTVQNVQIAHSHTGIWTDGGSVSVLGLENVQISDVHTAFDGCVWEGFGSAIAVSGCYNLTHDYIDEGYPLTIDDSTFSDVTNLDVGGTMTLGGDNNGFHNSPQFGTNPHTF